MKEYDHKSIEKKWQKIWDKKKVFAALDKSKKPKFYGLIEFPYPSGEGLHVGHIRGDLAMDVISRKRRMEGFNVLYPIGWDAFGLPTENYAIKTGIHPTIVTKKNTDTFRRQLKELGFSFDWSREINTTDPKYYKWTQWIFLQLLKHGLAYKKKMPINWCPKDKIGLANEEVVDGKCERCGTPVEKRDKEQWMLAITKYADRLDKDLDTVDYLEKIKIQQRNWIGRSEGAEIEFRIKNKEERRNVLPRKILIGTRNPAKIKMVKEAFPVSLGIEFVSLGDFPDVKDDELIEGDDFRENARKKAEFYFKKTGLPTISTDHILWIEKFPENGGYIIHARKLANPNSSRASDDEVAAWTEKLVDRYGESKAAFHYAVAFTDQSGTLDFAVKQREYLLQKSKSPKKNDGYVFDRYLKDLQTGEFRVEQRFQKGFRMFNEFINNEFIKIFSVPNADESKIKVFTTRPDTIFGATYLVVAPENPIIGNWKPRIKNWDEVAGYIKKAKNTDEAERTKEEHEKTGVRLDGVTAINPANGEEIPVWIADYVLADYGTGAIMAVPAHDERDFQFAKKYGLPVGPVIEPDVTDSYQELAFQLAFPSRDAMRSQIQQEQVLESLKLLRKGEFCYTRPGILINSGKFNGMNSEEAKWAITEAVGGKRITKFKLRDWVFSRQHYWGEPIPVVFCEKCKNVKQKILIIHGFEGGPDTNWKPWIKKELESRGFEVRIPKMSAADHPDLKQWMKELLPHIKDFGPNDIIIGHSLGSKAALHLLLKAKKKIGHLLLIGSAIGELSGRDWERMRKEWKGSDVDALQKFWLEKIDLNKISNYAEKINILISKDDDSVPLQTHNDIPRDWNFEVWDGFGHFLGKQIPELLDWVLRVKNDGIVPVPEKDLPVELPKVEKYLPTDTGESPLAAMTKWVNTKCPRCGSPAKRETDTMPNWAGSSWYYLAYIMRGISNFQFPISKYKEAFGHWLPVDWYNGGMEHTTLHLLYSRFWHKFLFDFGLVPTSEPYKKRTSHGLILAEGGVKMSKSKGNVINPDDLVERFGADALRVYEMFMGPFDQAIAWSTDGIVGTRRFIEKVWRIGQRITNKELRIKEKGKSEIQNPKLLTTNYSLLTNIVHKTIKKVDEDIEEMRFNTAISALMICANEMDAAAEAVPKELFEMFLKILSPFAPHIAEELWSRLGHPSARNARAGKDLFALRSWPAYDPKKIINESVTIVVQVNGKVRGQFSAVPDILEPEAIERAKSLPELQSWISGKQIKKTIFVKGRLVNLVI